MNTPASSPRHLRTVIPIAAVLVAMTILVAYSPTLYRLFCAATGLGGTTQRADAAPAAGEANADSREITVRFDTNVADGLAWDFRPEQPSVKVKIGVPMQVNFVARNLSDKPIVGRAVYNVTPYQVAPFFYKIQCFCFTEEKLGPGETAEMPVVFFLDKGYSKDPDASLFSDITLSYTFYPQDKLTPDAASQARDLGQGSQIEAASIHQNEAQQKFDNDAPRR
ncbi:MAG TPA: cytochrome c oxidase assembly protein [Beijerinckiaceae bacterium]|jgi:cytochrome c oxidase assembly protein subunit 11|nr:cytochrome c oxidase assembly protein [Beijerinckiaceae bacterium]